MRLVIGSQMRCSLNSGLNFDIITTKNEILQFLTQNLTAVRFTAHHKDTKWNYYAPNFTVPGGA